VNLVTIDGRQLFYRRTWDPNSIDDAIIPSTWGSKATQSYKQPW